MVSGAAIGGATANVPSWNDAYNVFNAGGVLDSMLRPAGGFGKFISPLSSIYDRQPRRFYVFHLSKLPVDSTVHGACPILHLLDRLHYRPNPHGNHSCQVIL